MPYEAIFHQIIELTGWDIQTDNHGQIVIYTGLKNVDGELVEIVNENEDASWGIICVMCSEGDFPQAINLDKLDDVIYDIEKWKDQTMSEDLAEGFRQDILQCIDYDRQPQGVIELWLDNEEFAGPMSEILKEFAKEYRMQFGD